MLRGPYRYTAAPSSDDEIRVPDREEVVSYALLAGAGSLPIADVLANHATFHTEATIGLFMVIAGVLGLASAVRAVWIARGSRRS